MDKLCRIYWRRAYSFVREQGSGPEEAKDFTQGFFALLLERRDLDTLRKEKGRLRSFLLRSLKRFLANERCRTMAIQHGKGRHLIPLDPLHDPGRMDVAHVDILTADQIYERRWAVTVLDQVLARLRDEYRVAGPATAGLFERLPKSLTEEPDRSSRADAAHEFGMTESAVDKAFHRLGRRYRQLLREEIGQTVAVPGDIEDELRHLIAVLRAYPAVESQHCF